MIYLMFFVIGFVTAYALYFIFNLSYFRRKRRKRKEEREKHPEKKLSATKVVLFSILLTYYIAFAVAVWVVIFKDIYQLPAVLTFVGGVTAFAVAFYCWKAKAENMLKIKAANPDLQGSLSDFSGMASQ